MFVLFQAIKIAFSSHINTARKREYVKYGWKMLFCHPDTVKIIFHIVEPTNGSEKLTVLLSEHLFFRNAWRQTPVFDGLMVKGCHTTNTARVYSRNMHRHGLRRFQQILHTASGNTFRSTKPHTLFKKEHQSHTCPSSLRMTWTLICLHLDKSESMFIEAKDWRKICSDGMLRKCKV